MYMTNHLSVIISQKYSFIIVWNIDGELHNPKSMTVTTVPRSYVSRSTFRTCPSFSSMTSLTFYDLLLLTHAYDFHMLAISHVYDFHMLTVFTCFSFTYFVRLSCTI